MKALLARSAVALALAAAAMLIGPSPAAQADPRDVIGPAAPSITVSYRELDISKPSGLEVLYSRIQQAARSVCRLGDSRQELSRERIARKCYQTAVEDAVRQINRPTLTALHRAKTRPVLG